MAYQFSSGFDFYTTASQVWDSVSATAPTISSANARFSGTHSQGASFAQNNNVTKNLTGTPSRLIAGVAVKFVTLPTIATDGFMEFLLNSTVQTGICVSSGGVLQFFRTNTGTLIGVTGGSILANVWYYIEIDVTFATTAVGTANAWVNGVQVITNSGNVTTATTTATGNQIRIGEFGNNQAGWLFDDLYCLDSTGGSLNAVLGDRRIITIMPNGAGSFTQFTPVGNANNYACVNDIPDSTSTYVSDSTVNDRDSYTYESVSLSGATPDALIPWARLLKDDPASHTVQILARDAGNDAASPSISVPSSVGQFNGGAFTTDPNGGGAWTEAGVNATEWGPKIIT